MNTDIQNRSDIEKLVNAFYEKVKKDETIGYFFEAVNWEKHLPVMYNFWENIIFSTGNFEGNPMARHKELDQKSPMSMRHFQQWIYLFNDTINELFEGENAELIKQRAQSIATVMQVKIFNS